MKVLHLPSDTGGNSWALAEAERELGLTSRVLVKQASWLGYPADMDLGWDKKSGAGKLLSALKTFSSIHNAYDILHFNFGTSLVDTRRFPLLDLPFYPKNKRIFFTYNGCDARQKRRTIERVSFSACHEPDCYGGMCNDGRLDSLREKKIRKAAEYAAGIFALNPDLLHVLPDKAMFLPYAVGGKRKAAPCSIGKKIRIAHAPTNRAAKGSKYIIEALDALRKKYPIEIVLIENVPNKDALTLYSTCDLVIDQVLIGWYGGLAVETMKMRKAVAAFVREEDLRFVPAEMAKDLSEAIINITPSNIEETLSLYLENTGLLKARGQAAFDYANRWHDPLYVASITKSYYEKAI